MKKAQEIRKRFSVRKGKHFIFSLIQK